MKQDQPHQSKARRQISQDPSPGTLRSRLGNFLYYAGLVGLAVGAGMGLGFYAADRGVRWLPTMMEILLLIAVFSLLVIITGKMVEGSATRLTQKGIRIRKRVIFCAVLIIIAIIVKLWGNWIQQPSRLTSLTPAEFDSIFEIDQDHYRQYDKGIEAQLRHGQVSLHDIQNDNDRVLTPGEEKALRNVWTTIYDYAFAMDQIRIFYEDWYRFDPSRAQRSYHLRSFLLTYAAELSLYEKSTRFIQLVAGNTNAVKFLDAPHSELLGADSFSKFREQLQGGANHTRVLAGREYLRWLDKGLNGRDLTANMTCNWLWDKIEMELALVDRTAIHQRAALSTKSDLEVLKRTIRHVWFPAQKGVALWMGNTRLRRVGIFLVTQAQREEMDPHLEPGDIMFSRKNWYMSNVGLPGFWPHAILYIGSPARFEAYFDNDRVKSYLKVLTGKDTTLGEYLGQKHPVRWLRYRTGKDGMPYRVIEGIKPGIVLNTLKGCCGDYMAAIRPRLDKKAKAQAIIEAFGHLDKPYDYDFDFATDHALVCTELIWRSYRPAIGKNGLNLPLVEMGGRKTLPALDIVKLFAAEHQKDDRQFDFVYFLDAKEKTQQAFVSTEAEFLKTTTRAKWSFALD